MKALWANRKARVGLLITLSMCALATFGGIFYDEADAKSTNRRHAVAAQRRPLVWHHHSRSRRLGTDRRWCRTDRWPRPPHRTRRHAVERADRRQRWFFGGKIDQTSSLLINVFLLIPGLPLMIVLAALLPSGPGSIALVLMITGWPWGARVLRSEAMSLRNRPYIEAARLTGDDGISIIFIHLVPNMASLIGITFIGATTYAVGAQVGLEFLGFGDPSAVTWGTNLYWATNDQSLLTGAWWTFVPPGSDLQSSALDW